MKPDKKTMTNLFSRRENFTHLIKKAWETLHSAKSMNNLHDSQIYSAAAEYIYEILADPGNQERYSRPFMTHSEIEDRLEEKEPRFTKNDVKYGIYILSSGIPPRIERRTLDQKTTYWLKGNKK